MIYLPDPVENEDSNDDKTVQNSCYLVEKVKDSKQIYEHAKQMAEQVDAMYGISNQNEPQNECLMIEVRKMRQTKEIKVSKLKNTETSIQKSRKLQSKNKQFSLFRTDSIVITVVFCLLLLPVTAAADTEYNVCKISRSGYAVAVPNDVVCRLPNLEDVERLNVSIYVPRSEPKTTVAWKCRVQRTQVCTHTGFF